jgi:hypothetical protein
MKHLRKRIFVRSSIDIPFPNEIFSAPEELTNKISVDNNWFHSHYFQLSDDNLSQSVYHYWNSEEDYLLYRNWKDSLDEDSAVKQYLNDYYSYLQENGIEEAFDEVFGIMVEDNEVLS